jgi:hypothetical protein
MTFQKLLHYVFPIFRDDVFGKMRFHWYIGKQNRNWFGSWTYFAPAGEQVQVYLDAMSSRPTDAQRAFFLMAQTRYEEMIPVASSLIEGEIQNKFRSFKFGDFVRECTPVWPDIPACDTTPVNWQIIFGMQLDLEPLDVIVTLDDLTPKEVRVTEG